VITVHEVYIYAVYKYHPIAATPDTQTPYKGSETKTRIHYYFNLIVAVELEIHIGPT
jgi:hypothetical protein